MLQKCNNGGTIFRLPKSDKGLENCLIYVIANHGMILQIYQIFYITPV